MADSTTQNSKADSKAAADEALVEALRKVGFEGPLWDRFAQELARYALPIIKAWIASLQMFAKCAEKHVRCPGPPPNVDRLQPEDATSMADEIITRALNRFRDKVLRPGRWSPQGGASLNTTFITQCIFQFPNVYRRWQLENRRLPTDDFEELELMESGPGYDPAGLIMIREEVAHALKHYVNDERVKHGLICKVLGYTTKEAAEMIGVTTKALDSAFQRHREALRKQPDGGEEGKSTP